ncbi:hypothetical protein I4F81_000344 [Pyropia yezoensis]|uniref:Uncharacterized protein n=1 Tax=Pyropia yezoensis TaxID=2788 RepID=A0ACC3BIG5_PYRYE|nr:hypothetical protein I4F81_000344 [Neopyropia yezoensis]
MTPQPFPCVLPTSERLAAAGGVVWAVLLLLAGASSGAAAPAAAPAPVASPTPADDSLGRFHFLRGLQCDTAAPGTVDGVRGFRVGADARGGGGGGTPTTIPVGDGVCWSPLTDAAALSTARPMRGANGTTTVGIRPTAAAATIEVVGELVSAAPVGSFAHHETYRQLPMGGGGGGYDGGQLLREDSLLRLLTLQRNSLSGAVHRVVGAYDVVTISRITAGYCRTGGCADASAVNVLGGARRGAGSAPSPAAVELLAYTPPGGWGADNRTWRHVGMDDEDLLALGRATLADPFWLAVPAAAAAVRSWRLAAAFSLTGWSRRDAADSSSQAALPLGAPWGAAGGDPRVDLGRPSPASSAGAEQWLQAVTLVLCAAPRSSFVVSSGSTRLCGTHQGGGDNPAAGAEVALGRSITACAHEVEPPPPEEVEGGVPPPAVGGGGSAAAGAGATTPVRHLAALKYAPVVTEAGRLSHQYDRARWGVEPPGEPATNADITLAIIVSLPEAIALVALVLTNPRWEKRDGLAFLLIWAAGGVSTAGIITLAAEEGGGQRWRAAAERVELSVGLHKGKKSDFSRNLERMPLYKVVTLFLAARLGYRDRYLRALAIGVGCTYMGLRRPSRRPYGPPIMGATSRTLFSLAFLVVAATSSLLLTWSIWWLATVGTSVPARRPFFLPGETPPTLIAAASESSASPTPVFQYSLAGGWPAAASGLRVAASGVGVVGALTYALLGTYARAGVARAAIGGGLGAVTGLAAASAVVDGIAIGRARSECADRACVTALPPGVGDNGEFCVCDVGAFFWITLGTDVALAVGAAVGAAVTLGGVVKRGQRA